MRAANGNLTRVVAAVMKRGEKILLCRRPPNKAHGGLWEFPGGKCEAGESDAETIRRELHEELGLIDAKPLGPPLFEHHEPGSPLVIAFIPVASSGIPRPIEHSEIRWLNPTAIHTLELAPSDAAFVRSISDTQGGLTGLPA